MQFPHYAEYLQIIATRDRGLALVGMLVLSALITLLNVRFGWPWLMPLTRLVLVAGFFVSLAVIVLVTQS